MPTLRFSLQMFIHDQQRFTLSRFPFGNLFSHSKSQSYSNQQCQLSLGMGQLQYRWTVSKIPYLIVGKINNEDGFIHSLPTGSFYLVKEKDYSSYNKALDVLSSLVLWISRPALRLKPDCNPYQGPTCKPVWCLTK